MLAISNFVGKIKLNFQYKMMTKKMCYNLFQKYKKKCFSDFKFSIEDFFSTCDQIRKKLWIWSHLLKKSLMENFTFCATYANRVAILILIRQLQK